LVHFDCPRVVNITMTPYAPTFRARPLTTENATARVTPREDVIWTRHVFRPPPLNVQPARPDLRHLGTIQRTEPWASWPRQSVAAR
jgi:hypothetical protein